MLPPPPVLAPPVGAALALALPVVSGAGGVAVVELGAGAALVELGAGVGGAVVGLVGGVGGAVVELDGVGFGVFEHVGVGVGVGFGLQWWPYWHDGDGDGDGVPPPPPPGAACAAVAPSSSIATPRAKLHARIWIRLGISRSFWLGRSFRSNLVRQGKTNNLALFHLVCQESQ